MQHHLLDHLFRHHHGKMVSILTRIFGLSHLETIEDAVQDTFIQASIKWRTQIPENPEAWLTAASKNRVLDIFRQINASKNREELVHSSSQAMGMAELFLDSEIEDSQLRMIFTACHPQLNQLEQIAFALKTVAGFSAKEIASALLTKEETVKKRLTRARKTIQEKQIAFSIPTGKELATRLDIVLDVLYLIFNEGFHSNKKETLIRSELCGEAIRLCTIVIKKETVRNAKAYALFALMCFHAARMESKLNLNNEIIDLKNQDRSLWYTPMIELGNSAMFKAMNTQEYSPFHYEAAIAAEHLKAHSFETTHWVKILDWYQQYVQAYPSPLLTLNMVLVYLQLKNTAAAYAILCNLKAEDFNQRAYLFYGAWAEYYLVTNESYHAMASLQKAIDCTSNETEKSFMQKKLKKLTNEC